MPQTTVCDVQKMRHLMRSGMTSRARRVRTCTHVFQFLSILALKNFQKCTGEPHHPLNTKRPTKMKSCRTCEERKPTQGVMKRACDQFGVMRINGQSRAGLCENWVTYHHVPLTCDVYPGRHDTKSCDKTPSRNFLQIRICCECSSHGVNVCD